MRNYYVRRRKERVTLQEFKELRDELADINGAPGDVAALRTASMKLLGRFLFKLAQQSPGKIKEWAPVAQLLLQNDYNDVLRELKDKEEKLRRELKAEDHKIRREALEFAKTKFQFDVTEQAMKALPELQELAQARKDPDTKRYESNAFLNRARRVVAGVVWEVRPESAQEEAEMLAARKAREERKQRRLEWEQREKITGHEPPTPSSPYYAEYLAEKAKRENKGMTNDE